MLNVVFTHKVNTSEVGIFIINSSFIHVPSFSNVLVIVIKNKFTYYLFYGTTALEEL